MNIHSQRLDILKIIGLNQGKNVDICHLRHYQQSQCRIIQVG
jgi:hypothetical protein